MLRWGMEFGKVSEKFITFCNVLRYGFGYDEPFSTLSNFYEKMFSTYCCLPGQVVFLEEAILLQVHKRR